MDSLEPELSVLGAFISKEQGQVLREFLFPQGIIEVETPYFLHTSSMAVSRCRLSKITSAFNPVMCCFLWENFSPLSSSRVLGTGHRNPSPKSAPSHRLISEYVDRSYVG